MLLSGRGEVTETLRTRSGVATADRNGGGESEVGEGEGGSELGLRAESVLPRPLEFCGDAEKLTLGRRERVLERRSCGRPL